VDDNAEDADKETMEDVVVEMDEVEREEDEDAMVVMTISMSPVHEHK
jgi:hypothetical protein